MIQLLEVARAAPERIFTTKEAAAIMGCATDTVPQAIKYAVANRALFCTSLGRGVPMLLSGSPISADAAMNYAKEHRKPKPVQNWRKGGKAESPWLTDPDDPRIGKVVPGWQPPLMRHVRGGQ